MSNLLLLIFCLLLGQALRRARKLPENTAASLNGFIVYVSLPAVVLQTVHRIPFSRDILLPASMAWIVFAAAVGIFLTAARLWNWDRRSTGALVMTAGLCNTSFVGFPLIEALYGKQAMGTAVLADQPGSFLVLTTLGMAAAAAFGRPRGGSGKAPGFPLAASIRKMIAFPSFSVMIAALILQPWRFPDALESFLEKLGGTMAPLALFSVGFGLDLRLKALRRFAGPLAGGLFYKLLFAPALMTAVAYGVFGIRNEIAQVTIAQAAMAPMITGGIVAIDAGLEPELANLMVGVGIPLSLITVPIWAWLLRQP